MSLDKAMKMLKYDKRLTEWNLNHGQLSQEEMNKHLEQLPDSAANVDLLNINAPSDADSADRFTH